MGLDGCRSASTAVAGGLIIALLLLAGCTTAGPAPAPVAPSSAGTPEAAPPGADRSAPGPSRNRSAVESVRLSFGGDVMFEGGLAALLDEPRSGLAPITPAVSAADFTMVNLEAAITTRGTRDPKSLEDASQRYYFRSGPEVLTALAAAGVDAVSVANNHGADFGSVGLADTLRAKRSGVLPVVGVGRTRAEAFIPHRETLKGQPFAFFAADASFLESRSPTWAAGLDSPGLAAARGAGRTALLTAVRRAAAAGDTVVAYLHWGQENTATVDADQKSLATALAHAGAAIVVGSHAHRLQGGGWLGSTYVAYGLGNFVWYHGTPGETGLLDLTVSEGRVVAETWRPATIPPAGGLPDFTSGADAREARTAWSRLRSGTGLTEVPVAPSDPAAPPPYASSIRRIDAALERRMASSHRAGCPVPLSDLRYLRVSHWDFTGRVRQGELVVAAEHAEDVVGVFRALYAAGFPIQRMRLVSDYGGDDDRSMAANNSSAYNCRTVAGTDRWSQHSFGAAIDLNPVQNPYVTQSVAPPAGKPYARASARRDTVAGLITPGSVAVRAFDAAGWEWGGAWSSPKDYQHFSAAGS